MLGQPWQFLKIRQECILSQPLTLPFTCALRGHCRVIDISWPNFSIIVETEAMREGERWGSGQNTHSSYGLCSLSYMGTVHGTSEQLQQ